MKLIVRLLCINAMIFVVIFSTQAQDAVLKYGISTQTGITLNKVYTIDNDFGRKYGKNIQAPFKILLPVVSEFQTLLAVPPSNDATVLKITFATLDQELIENVLFVPFSAPLLDIDKRIAITAKLLSEQGFAMASAGKTNPEKLAVVKTEVEGTTVIVVIGRYMDPQWGPMWVRIAGYLSPNSEYCMALIMNINPRLSTADSSEKLHTHGIVSKVANSFIFIE
jgi:hypothetical protein